MHASIIAQILSQCMKSCEVKALPQLKVAFCKHFVYLVVALFPPPPKCYLVKYLIDIVNYSTIYHN